jgi:hypothetical protein
MGMESSKGAAASPPPALRLVAAVQVAEAAGLSVAAVLVAVDTAAGRSYHQNSGIALTLIAFGTAAALAWIAAGLARQRPWSRTPAALTQLFTGGVGIYLLEGHRLDWGICAVLLAVAGLIGLMAPSSVRALNRPRSATASSAAQPRSRDRASRVNPRSLAPP